MPIEHIPADSPSEKASEVLERDGCVVIDGLLDRDAIDQINREMVDYLDATSKGTDEFGGFETRRTGTLVARSPKSREVIMNRGGQRCPCGTEPGGHMCLSCQDHTGTPPGVTNGARPAVPGQQMWTPDAARDPAQQFISGGYMRTGYDTGRVW